MTGQPSGIQPILDRLEKLEQQNRRMKCQNIVPWGAVSRLTSALLFVLVLGSRTSWAEKQNAVNGIDFNRNLITLGMPEAQALAILKRG